MARHRGRTFRVKMPGPDIEIRADRILVEPGRKVRLDRDFDPGWTAGWTDKASARAKLEENVQELSRWQDLLWAQDRKALLIVLQAMDAAGKDGVIRHVMSGVNPQGCHVTSFKAPTSTELDHDFLWRCHAALPERGRIGIFNRSHYEEVLVVRVHPELLGSQRLPDEPSGDDVWDRRYEAINAFERQLVESGTHVVKFFLHLSKAEQKRRFLDRLDDPAKAWKFSVGDVRERGHWDLYRDAYERMLSRTSTPWAPWFVVPADHKWFTRLAVSEMIVATLKGMGLHYPRVDAAGRKALAEARKLLEDEKDEVD
ncbi:MAG TPA: polyphosphate kinase 2 family protein [Planctomycetota bacterium]|nr:polyphosphate kinase 2 family protein [Planctomycetota bacterium]